MPAQAEIFKGALWTGLPARDPLFIQVAREIEQLIRRGAWKAGDMLPNENELSQKFRVSPGTIRRALCGLTEKGIVVRQQGKGTFVADYKANARSVVERYVMLQPDGNTHPSPEDSELLCFEEKPAMPDAAERLGVEAGTPLIHIVRVHYICPRSGREPVSLDENFLRKDYFGALTRENLMHHEERLLYAFYQRQCGVTITRCVDEVKAGLLLEQECQRFNLPSPQPVVVVRRVAYTLGDVPVEYRIQRCITRKYHLVAAGTPA